MWRIKIKTKSGGSITINKIHEIELNGSNEFILTREEISKFKLPFDGVLCFRSETEICTLLSSEIDYVTLLSL